MLIVLGETLEELQSRGKVNILQVMEGRALKSLPADADAACEGNLFKSHERRAPVLLVCVEDLQCHN